MSWIEWLIILGIGALLFRPRQFGRATGEVAGGFRHGARDGDSPPAAKTTTDEAADGERRRLLAVLELPPEATPEQIRRAWRELAKVWHPDRFAHDAALQARATTRLAEINAAYDLLTHAPR